MALRFSWLGVPNTEVKGRTPKLGVKLQCLLAYLSLNGRANRRDLARLLWAEASDPLNSVSAARTNLAQVLGKHFKTDLETLEILNFECDVHEFRRLLEIGDLQAAWDVWGGSFLAGVRLPEWDSGYGQEFEEWLLETREALEAERSELAFKLARLALEGQRFEEAIPFLELTQAEHLEPREDAARILMLVAGAVSREDMAVATFSRLERRLSDELGVPSTQKTRDALEMARSDADLCRAQLEQDFKVQKPVLSLSIGLEETDVPLVGREIDLELLLAELERSRFGETRLVLISGEPGVGKTRIAREIARNGMTLSPGFLVASGVSAPTGIPLQAFDRVARKLIRSRPEILQTMNNAWRDALARFVPDILVPSSPNTNPELERRHLFEAIRVLLTNPDRPTLLLIDDLQWADEGTLELIVHLMRHANPRGFLLLATMRDTETSKANLKPILELIGRENLGRRVKLEGLNEKNVERLAETLGRNINAGSLHRTSGGNPFYLLELLRASDIESATRVHDLVRARLEHLPDEARQVLEAAAILGDGSSMNHLRKVSGRSLEELETALIDLERASLLQLEDEGTRFHHDLTREVVLTDLKASRRALMHLRAARSRATTPALAARHYLESRTTWDDSDATPAVNAMIEAGNLSALRGDLNAGLEWYGFALENAHSPASRVRALTEQARTLERYGRHVDAMTALDQADVLNANLTDPVQRASTQIARANLLALKLGRLEEAQTLVDTALTALEGLKGEEAQRSTSDALNVAGTVARLQNKLEQAAELFSRSLNIRKALDDKSRVADSLTNLALVYTKMQDSRAENTHLECMKVRQEIGDSVGMARALNNLGIYYTEVEKDYKKARDTYQEALKIYRENMDSWGETASHLNIGAANFYLEKFEEARKQYQIALKITEENRDNNNRILALSNLAEVGLELGDLRFTQDMLDQLEKALLTGELAHIQNDVIRYRALLVEKMSLRN
jgi:tetratricopeptide (TPR) repeat protein/DNA-binding SARP family transcriptional activator